MGFTESKAYPTLQDMLSSYFFPGEEEIEDTAAFARRLQADNPADYLGALRDDIARFLQSAGNRAEERFQEEFLSYFAPSEQTAGEWLAALATALSIPADPALDRGSRYT